MFNIRFNAMLKLIFMLFQEEQLLWPFLILIMILSIRLLITRILMDKKFVIYFTQVLIASQLKIINLRFI